MAMVDDASCSRVALRSGVATAQDAAWPHSEQGWRHGRTQSRGGDNVVLQQHRQQCPREDGERRRVGSGASWTRTAGGWHHRLKRRRRRYRWLDHERRRCSLEGAATTSSSGGRRRSGDDGRATQTRSLIGKKKKQQTAPSPPLSAHRGQPRAGETEEGEETRAALPRPRRGGQQPCMRPPSLPAAASSRSRPRQRRRWRSRGGPWRRAEAEAGPQAGRGGGGDAPARIRTEASVRRPRIRPGPLARRRRRPRPPARPWRRRRRPGRPRRRQQPDPRPRRPDPHPRRPDPRWPEAEAAAAQGGAMATPTSGAATDQPLCCLNWTKTKGWVWARVAAPGSGVHSSQGRRSRSRREAPRIKPWALLPC
ncbi:unnamed protein product [Urochloa humidicola]